VRLSNRTVPLSALEPPIMFSSVVLPDLARSADDLAVRR
jgi:hypothetical protein